jgi:hypothetical protein
VLATEPTLFDRIAILDKTRQPLQAIAERAIENLRRENDD